MTFAYDIEATAINWTSTVVGTGNFSWEALWGGKEQKRTLTLSNSEVIWDLSGNVFEWTDWTLGGSLDLEPTSCTDAAWTELPLVSGKCPVLASADYFPGNPAGKAAGTYNSNL